VIITAGRQEEQEGAVGQHAAVRSSVVLLRARDAHALGQQRQRDHAEHDRRERIGDEQPQERVVGQEASQHAPQGEPQGSGEPRRREGRHPLAFGHQVGHEGAGGGTERLGRDPRQEGPGREAGRRRAKYRLMTEAALANIATAMVVRRPSRSAMWPPTTAASSSPIP
jgi:hypothetical protein